MTSIDSEPAEQLIMVLSTHLGSRRVILRGTCIGCGRISELFEYPASSFCTYAFLHFVALRAATHVPLNRDEPLDTALRTAVEATLLVHAVYWKVNVIMQIVCRR